MKIALAQMEVVPGRPDRNSAVMLQLIAEARAQQARIVAFPEMAIPGYLLGDAWEQDAFLRDCESFGREIVAASAGLCVLFGNVGIDWNKKGADGRVRKYNALFVAQDGELRGQDNFPYPFRIKTLHPNYREFDDTRHFFSLPNLALELDAQVNSLLQPVKLTIDRRRLSLGCILCEDGWYQDYSVNPVALLHRNGPLDLVFNLSSSPFTLGKNNKRNRVFSKQAAEISTPLVYVNNVGLQNNGKTIFCFDGLSTVYDAAGRIVASSPAFESCLKVLDIDLDNGAAKLPALTVPADSGIDSVYRALRYGADRFVAQIGMERVVIGASGGIDSAVSAALYCDILGPDRVLLANMPSIYNSQTTIDLARDLATNLGCLYTVIPIQPSVDLTTKQITQTPLVNLRTGEESKLCISEAIAENIQARDRSSRVLAVLAAAFGGGFTCNANKSELTVGYTTLYGDQSGFLALLADLWKHQVYELGEYLNRQVFASPVIPDAVFSIVPSAELSAAQSIDDGKGDPLVYPYHDFLFRAFMERWQKATPEDILEWYARAELESRIGCEPGLVSRLFPDAQAFIDDLECWWRLYSGLGVAKRIQAPPVMAVSRRAYGFDHREAQNQPYFTAAYRQLRAKLLGNDSK
ncbi:MAG: NAD(+) synthase [Gammaproteobacteria bacterium]|nr:NAD(+) synthase [Gammaproteobacteria bacterium]